jgi:hypothetical protein
MPSTTRLAISRSANPFRDRYRFTPQGVLPDLGFPLVRPRCIEDPAWRSGIGPLRVDPREPPLREVRARCAHCSVVLRDIAKLPQFPS